MSDDAMTPEEAEQFLSAVLKRPGIEKIEWVHEEVYDNNSVLRFPVQDGRVIYMMPVEAYCASRFRSLSNLRKEGRGLMEREVIEKVDTAIDIVLDRLLDERGNKLVWVQRPERKS